MHYTSTSPDQGARAPAQAGLSASLLAYVFLLIVFAQNPPWPAWELPAALLAFSVPLGVLLSAGNGLRYFNGGAFGLFVVIAGLVYFFLYHGLWGGFRLSSAIFVLTLLLIFKSSVETGARAFDLIATVFAWVLAISLIAWVLWQMGVPLPSSSLAYGEWKGKDLELDNFYLFVAEQQTLIQRFYSVFDEPGVVGTLAAMTLCGLRFDFSQKRSWVILVAGLCSWSLAFVVLSALGIIFFKKGRQLKIVIIAAVALAMALMVLLFGGASPSEDSGGLLLIYRIVNFSEHGVGSRTDELLNAYFAQYIGSLSAVFGKGTAFFQQRPDLSAGQGAVFYLIEYGMVGMLLVILMYVAILRVHMARHAAGYLLLLIFLLSFLQRPHLLTPWQIVLFWSILCSWAVQREPHQTAPGLADGR